MRVPNSCTSCTSSASILQSRPCGPPGCPACQCPSHIEPSAWDAGLKGAWLLHAAWHGKRAVLAQALCLRSSRLPHCCRPAHIEPPAWDVGMHSLLLCDNSLTRQCTRASQKRLACCQRAHTMPTAYTYGPEAGARGDWRYVAIGIIPVWGRAVCAACHKQRNHPPPPTPSFLQRQARVLVSASIRKPPCRSTLKC